MSTTLASPAWAESLRDALAAAYANNPTLLAERASLRATDESVPQALSGWRPTVSVVGEAGREWQDRNILADQTLDPVTLQFSVTQPLYTGGRTEAQIKSSESLVQAGRARLSSVEQQILLQAVTAYMDVLRDQAVLELNRNNEQVLRRQLDASNDRFRVGEITRTDVVQAEARLSRATSDRVQAEGNLISSRAVYQRVVGEMPRNLDLPPQLPSLPASEDEAMTIAFDANPDIRTALHREEASQSDIDVAFGNLLPTVSLVGDLLHADETSTEGLDVDSASIAARVTVPLYQGGADYSQVRQRKQINSQRRIEIDDVRRQVRQAVTRAWETFTTARSRIVANREQARASSIALEGVTQEAQVGSRTTLDVLDAEQERLDAEVALVTAQRDEYVAAYALLQAIGRLTAVELGLPVEIYDPQAHYGKIRNRWIGLDAEE